MEFLQNHHSANSSEPSYTLGTGEFIINNLSINKTRCINDQCQCVCSTALGLYSSSGSVGIEANIPSGLCANSLGVLGSEDTLTEDHHHHHHHEDATAAAIALGTLQELQASPSDDINDQTHHIQNSAQAQVVGEFGANFWVDDMAGFPLPPLDLDPLPPGLFSPCSATYK